MSANIATVNDASSFTARPIQSATASAGLQTVSSWASGFTPGPSDKATQTLLGYTVVSNSSARHRRTSARREQIVICPPYLF